MENTISSKDYSTHVPPPASIWHRSAAMIIDMVILGIGGHVSSWLLWSVWFQLGPYGRWVGIPIVLLYFGIFNSNLGGGQTPGKRFTHIAVRGTDNRPIDWRRSLIRTTILATPVSLLGWSLPVFEIDVMQWLQLSVALGLGSVLAYTFFFNQITCQAWHDLVCKTYVVHLEGHAISAFPQSPDLRKTAGLLFVVAIAVAGLVNFSSMGATTTAETDALTHQLKAEERFFSVIVEDRTIPSSEPPPRLLNIRVWYKGYLDTEEAQTALINSIARTALANIDTGETFDIININVTFAYDILIAQRTVVVSEFQTVNTWRERVGQLNQ
ncbi:MAG: RDD family protein [Anaerolineae bacterium]|nr:RDD family protein [Anaerolineae bacterium]